MGLNFTGANSVDAASVSPPSVGSVSFWVRPQSIAGTQRIFATGDDFEARFDGGTLYADWGTSGSVLLNCGSFVVGQLGHCVCTWNVGTGAKTAYRDGVSSGSASDSNGVTSGPFQMAVRPGTSDYFTGEVYDARFYTRILSAAEVATIYAARGRDGIINGLACWWKMDERASGLTVLTNGVKCASGDTDLTPSGSPTPTYIYTADIQGGRRRVA